MDFEVETAGGVAIWVAVMVLAVFAFYRAKKRRRHIGSGAAGVFYDMMSEEKRNAIEIIAEDKAAERDFEREADDKDRTEERRDR